MRWPCSGKHGGMRVAQTSFLMNPTVDLLSIASEPATFNRTPICVQPSCDVVEMPPLRHSLCFLTLSHVNSAQFGLPLTWEVPKYTSWPQPHACLERTNCPPDRRGLRERARSLPPPTHPRSPRPGFCWQRAVLCGLRLLFPFLHNGLPVTPFNHGNKRAVRLRHGQVQVTKEQRPANGWVSRQKTIGSCP